MLIVLTVAIVAAVIDRTPSRAVDVAVHPRLLFSDAEKAALLAKMTDGAGEDDGGWNFITTRADTLAATTSVPTIVGSENGFNNVPLLGVAHQLAPANNPNKDVYRDKCRVAVGYLAASFNPEGPASGGNDTVYEQAMRLTTLSLGFDLCYSGVADPERSNIIAEIQSYLTFVTQWHDQPWRTDWQNARYHPYTSNKGIMAATALGLGSIVLRGEIADTALLDSALTQSEEILDAHLGTMIPTDGAYTEGVLYASWAMRFLVQYIEARWRFDGVDYRTDDGVENMVNWLAYEALPHQAGYINNLNDTLWSTFPLALHSSVLSWAQTAYNSGVARWLWQSMVPAMDYSVSRDNVATALWSTNVAPVQPSAVLPPSRLFTDRGLYSYHTGWPVPGGETDDTAFSLYAGKFWGGHGQEDQGQITLISRGERFLIDNGYTAAGKHTSGHNLILIDGADQHNTGGAIGIDGSVDAFVSGSFADYLHTNIASAYTTHSPFNNQGAPFPGSDWSWGTTAPTPVLNADRLVQVMKPGAGVGEYIVLLDDIAKDGGTHTYDWLLHSAPNNTITTGANPVVITGGAEGNKLDVFFASPDIGSLTLSQAAFDATGQDFGSKRLKATIAAINPRFLTILRPSLSTGEIASAYTALSPENGSGATVVWANGVNDTILAARTGMTSGDNVATDGRLAVVRRLNAVVQGYSLGEGTSLTIDGAAYVTIDASASVVSDGTTITVSDPDASYVLLGPSVTSVRTSDGTVLTTTKVGEWIYLNTAPPTDTSPPNGVTDLQAGGG